MKIVFTPDWFLGHDVLIEVFSFVILFLFFLFAIKGYNLSKKKNLFYLGLGFLLIAVAELSTILTKFVLYFDTSIVQEIGRIVITQKIVKTVDIFYYLGFFFHKFLTLLGLYIIYKIPSKNKIKHFVTSSEFFLTVYLLLLVSFICQSYYYFFHLTALFLLCLIIYNYWSIYKKGKMINTRILLTAFVLLAVSQILFIFSGLNLLYVTAQGIQLVSYIILLILIVRILKNGKKKEQSRDSI